MIANAYRTVQDEVHLKDFLFLVIDDVLVFLLAEMSRLKAEGNIIEELAVFVLLGIEEEAEVVEDVIEEVMDDYTAFDLPRQRVNELVVFLDLAEAIIGPEVLEVLVDLTVERVGKWLVTEAGQKGHPVMQVEGLLFIAEILVEGGDNLDERAHDVREERHACKHDEYAEYHFMATLRTQITVAHRRKRCDGEVTRRDHLVVAWRLFEGVCLDEVRVLLAEEARN